MKQIFEMRLASLILVNSTLAADAVKSSDGSPLASSEIDGTACFSLKFGYQIGF